jgi:hypothetical protein
MRAFIKIDYLQNPLQYSRLSLNFCPRHAGQADEVASND